jgi:hypothetical protein
MGDAIGDGPIGRPCGFLVPLALASTPGPWTHENLVAHGWTLSTPINAADDATPHPTGPTKPYNEAVNDVHRYLKEVVEKAPDTQIEGPVKEGVIDDLDKAIEKRKAQKEWPGALR